MQVRDLRQHESTDLLAEHEALIHRCDAPITTHADLIELQAWVEGEDRDSVD